MVEVEACLGQVVEEAYPGTRAEVVVVEVPSLVRVEGVAVLACLVKEVEEEEEEYRHVLVKEEAVGVGERACLLGLVGVGVEVEVEVEGAHQHSGQGEEGQVVDGPNQVLAQEQ